MKSSSRPVAIPWRVRSSAAMLSATAPVSSAVAADTVMLLTCVMPSSFFCTVVYGTRIWSSMSSPMPWPFEAMTPITLNGCLPIRTI